MSETESTMTPWRLIELIETICATESLDKNKEMFLEIVAAAEERHDDALGDCLRDLFAEWMGIDSMDYPSPPSGEELRCMFPTLALCCVTSDINWMCRRSFGKVWNSDVTNATWQPSETVTLETLREGLRIACYTEDGERFHVVSHWLQSIAKKNRGDSAAEVVRMLFGGIPSYRTIADRAICLQSQLGILAHFCKVSLPFGEVFYVE